MMRILSEGLIAARGRLRLRLNAAPRAIVVVLALALIAACSRTTGPVGEPRSYRMGFSHIPPRLTIEAVIATLEAWQPRGDAAVVLVTPEWSRHLADTSPAFIIRREYLQIVERYRSRDFLVVVMIDATDGLDRSREHPQLIAAGRSLAEPSIRAIYREFVTAVDTILHPDYLGVAMETNLIRAIAPAAVYSSMRTAANEAAAALNARGTTAKLFVSVQVETAWGKLPVAPAYLGIAQDRADFPFIEALGLSSYPNLTTVSVPEDLPLDYYSRLVPDGGLPMMIVEGGWSSTTVAHPSSPELQARYIRRQLELADRAALAAIFQLTFTDLDVSTYGADGARLGPFASMGLVTGSFAPKPALSEWDRAFARPVRDP